MERAGNREGEKWALAKHREMALRLGVKQLPIVPSFDQISRDPWGKILPIDLSTSVRGFSVEALQTNIEVFQKWTCLQKVEQTREIVCASEV